MSAHTRIIYRFLGDSALLYFYNIKEDCSVSLHDVKIQLMEKNYDEI